MTQSFDLAVIGTGSAGTTAALKCARANWRVAIVDDLPFGGTCQLRGCDPKKVLVGASSLIDWSQRMHARGVVREPLVLDWAGLMRFKRTFTDPVPERMQQRYAEHGVHAMHGHAQFIDATTLRVGEETITARHVLIATGAIPMPLHVTGEELLTTSDRFMDIDRLPSPIVFIGGGFISFEFAHLAARAGAQAHIIELSERPLAGFDPDLVDRLVDATRTLGIRVHLETKVMGLEKRGESVVVHARHGNDDVEISGALAVHGGGRVPDLDGLNLEAAGIERTKKGIKVNEYLQNTGNPSVYAAGDAADGGGLPLTPVAGTEGDVAADNMLHGNRRTLDFSGLTSLVYTDPPLSACGLSEEQARERGIRYSVKTGDTSEWYSSRCIGAAPSGYKLMIDDEQQTVIGAHILGAHAEELANVFALAVRARVPLAVLRETFFGYPTASSDIEYMI